MKLKLQRLKDGYDNMYYQKLNENSYFIYSEDIELLMAASNILEGEKWHTLCTETYSSGKLDGLKKKYAYLVEIFQAVGCPSGMLEFLTDYPLVEFNLEEYREHLLQMDVAAFVSSYFNIFNEELVREALENEDKLDRLFREYEKFLGSYLGFKVFIRETGKIINDYFAFARELDTEEFHEKNRQVRAVLQTEAIKAQEGLKATKPLEFSQELMGKVFYNRGPYKEFYFTITLFAAYKKIRFFGKNQVLFYSLRESREKQEQLLKQLKAIGDETRLKIISLLNEKEPLRGLDIAKELSMAPSTISHHMDQMKNCGLLNEEQSKSSKFYSISRTAARELLKALSELLDKKGQV